MCECLCVKETYICVYVGGVAVRFVRLEDVLKRLFFTSCLTKRSCSNHKKYPVEFKMFSLL